MVCHKGFDRTCGTMPGVFISYRREDSAGHTGRLFDRLRARLGHDRVFMDITGIEAGVDFVDTIERAIGSCDVLLAVIGPEWLSCTDVRGRRRLEDESDLIRIEISAALTRKVRVIPVLIAGAAMPAVQDLPDDLKPLARRQAAELRDTRWDADTNDLVAVLERVLAGSVPVQSATTSTSTSRQADGVARPTAADAVRRPRPFWRWATAALAGSTLAAGAIFFLELVESETVFELAIIEYAAVGNPIGDTGRGIREYRCAGSRTEAA